MMPRWCAVWRPAGASAVSARGMEASEELAVERWRTVRLMAGPAAGVRGGECLYDGGAVADRAVGQCDVVAPIQC